MKTVIRTWGNSLALRIPKAMAIDVGLSSGKEVELSVRSDGLRISPMKTLEALLRQVTPQNIHQETMIDSPVGREIW